MRPLAIALLIFCFTSQAFAGAQDTLNQWQYVQDPDSGATWQDISDFITQHPSWPSQKKIQVRAERAMRGAGLSDAEIIRWFESNPPASGIGKWSYAEALSRRGDNVAELVKEAWKDADLTEDEERTFLASFEKHITKEDHIARTERLLWEGKISPARRMDKHLPVNYQVLAHARAALQKDEKHVDKLIAQLVGKLKEDPGLLFDRMQYRNRKNDKAGVRDILLSAPRNVPYPERWWKMREMEVRKAIDEGHYSMARKLLSNHGQLDGAPLADALWLDGWVKLQFTAHPKEAYEAFYHMHDAVRTPVSKARAAYWAGRAAKKSGDADTAAEWFRTASKHSTTFYGQLAATELDENTTLFLPDEPSLSFFSSDPVIADDMEEAIRISVNNGDEKTATKLISHLIEKAETEHSMLTVAELGQKLEVPHISVKAAKKAQQLGVVLKNVGYPRPITDKDLPIERALTLAITRQESEFDPHAESPSGALGMMQLLPGTAKETAGKIGVPYDRGALDSPDYNIRLGSHYLARMIRFYDDSYIMGIASYNAGPGNVRKWQKQFGGPGDDVYGAIDWIEKIPFYETRNYVQRVMENLQVYRALDGDDKLKIRDDLLR